MNTRERFLTNDEMITPGHLACQGCGASVGLRMALNVLGPKTILVLPACCSSVICGPYPQTSINVPVLHTAFETAASAASGVSAALEIRGRRDTTVLAWAGDGGTMDIGLQALSGAAERNENFLYICYDNEAYMNTGIQRSSATPEMAWTTTTPSNHPKEGPKKNITAIMAAHGIPYIATANIAFPDDYITKLEKAKKLRGLRFIHLLSPCPAGWKMPSEHSIKAARLATDTKIFPLFEIVNGEEYHLTVKPAGLPVESYLNMQGRFSHLKKRDIKKIQIETDMKWEKLAALTGKLRG